MDFAHARTSVARQGARTPTVGPPPPTGLHPDTASSDLFERFEFLSVVGKRTSADDESRRCQSGQKAKEESTGGLQVTTQFDARVHNGTQRGDFGAASFVDASAPSKRGPLSELFLQYATGDSFGDGNALLNAASIGDLRQSALLSKHEVFKMMRDFGVVGGFGNTSGTGNTSDIGSQLLSQRDVEFAFTHADSPAVGDDAVGNKTDQLDFAEFTRFVANLVFLKNGLSVNGMERVNGMTSERTRDDVSSSVEFYARLPQTTVTLLKLLKCDKIDTRRLRAFMDAKNRNASRNPRADETKLWAVKNDRRPALPSGFRRKENTNSNLNSNTFAMCCVRAAKGVALSSSSVKGVALSSVSADDSALKHFVTVYDAVTKREATTGCDLCKWREYPHPSVDCGTLFPGDLRRFRVRIANRNLHRSVTIYVTSKSLPCLELRHAEQTVLAPGLTSTIDLVAGADVCGEWLGSIVVSGVWNDLDHDDSNNPAVSVSVPVYLNVVHRDREIVTRAGDVVGMRGFERERNCLASTSHFAWQPGQAPYGFKPEPKRSRFVTAGELLRMREPVFVSKRNSLIEKKEKSGRRDERVGNNESKGLGKHIPPQVSLAAERASALEENLRRCDRGWWGENSAARVFDEKVSMGETVAAAASSERDAETAFRLSRKGLRY